MIHAITERRSSFFFNLFQDAGIQLSHQHRTTLLQVFESLKTRKHVQHLFGGVLTFQVQEGASCGALHSTTSRLATRLADDPLCANSPHLTNLFWQSQKKFRMKLPSSRVTGVRSFHVHGGFCWRIVFGRAGGSIVPFARASTVPKTATHTSRLTKTCYTPLATHKNHGHTHRDTGRSSGAVLLVVLQFYGHFHQQELSQLM